jgi:hypothetical protein
MQARFSSLTMPRLACARFTESRCGHESLTSGDGVKATSFTEFWHVQAESGKIVEQAEEK